MAQGRGRAWACGGTLAALAWPRRLPGVDLAADQGRGLDGSYEESIRVGRGGLWGWPLTGIIPEVMSPLLRKPLAEALSTFVLVFAGTGAIVINDVSGGAVTHLGIALVFGLVVMAMIYSLGDVSGAHMNLSLIHI